MPNTWQVFSNKRSLSVMHFPLHTVFSSYLEGDNEKKVSLNKSHLPHLSFWGAATNALQQKLLQTKVRLTKTAFSHQVEMGWNEDAFACLQLGLGRQGKADPDLYPHPHVSLSLLNFSSTFPETGGERIGFLLLMFNLNKIWPVLRPYLYFSK